MSGIAYLVDGDTFVFARIAVRLTFQLRAASVLGIIAVASCVDDLFEGTGWPAVGESS